jgi:hypothetical protein
VLTSLRALHVLAVVDVEGRSVVWAARGMWRGQHDPQFLENGRLLLYDNFGDPQATRVLEYDPVTQAMPWSYASEDRAPFLAVAMGVTQRLANGNTLLVEPQKGRIMEVAPSKEVVWEMLCPLPQPGEGSLNFHALTAARRYGPHQLTFLEGTRARP